MGIKSDTLNTPEILEPGTPPSDLSIFPLSKHWQRDVEAARAKDSQRKPDLRTDKETREYGRVSKALSSLEIKIEQNQPVDFKKIKDQLYEITTDRNSSGGQIGKAEDLLRRINQMENKK